MTDVGMMVFSCGFMIAIVAFAAAFGRRGGVHRVLRRAAAFGQHDGIYVNRRERR